MHEPARNHNRLLGRHHWPIQRDRSSGPVIGLDLTIPHLFAIGLGLLIGGIVLIVMAIALIVLGARTQPQSRPVTDLAARA